TEDNMRNAGRLQFYSFLLFSIGKRSKPRGRAKTLEAFIYWHSYQDAKAYDETDGTERPSRLPGSRRKSALRWKNNYGQGRNE
ncbi:MAG: hypothetical protein VXX28_06450, partial [Verrucomicrobiota bacterium]|nr:hypothetical protein [Verrucomicrobiota bacterium]